MKPPEEAKRRLVAEWLDKAAGDLEAARILAEQRPAVAFAAAFHAQQTVEKALKAFLTSRQVEFPKTHDLAALLDLVAKADPALAGTIREVVELTPYGVDARYPGDASPPDAVELKRAVALADGTLRAVRQALGQAH